MTPPLSYFDNAATTKPMYVPPHLTADLWGNPGSPDQLGTHSKEQLRLAKLQIAQQFGLPGAENVIEVCSATEASNLVLASNWDLIVSTGLEHEATLRTLQKGKKNVLILPNYSNGLINIPESLPLIEKALTRDNMKILLSVIYANNEIGTVQTPGDLAQLKRAMLIRSNVVRVHLDIVQAVGHIPVSLAERGNLFFVDYASISAHKWHGPPGVGLLLSKDHSMLQPLMFGGAQQGGLRPGAEHCALVAQAAFVLQTILPQLVTLVPRMQNYSRRIMTVLQPFVDNGLVIITGHTQQRNVNHVSFCVAYGDSTQIIEQFNSCAICVSSGSACSGTKATPSHVLLACSVPARFLRGAVRITSSMQTSDYEVTRVCRVLRLILTQHQNEIKPSALS
jgi:cysteine desulfurase